MMWPVAPGVVRGERIATSKGLIPATLHLAGGRVMRVSHIDDVGGARAAEVLDARNLIVMPGLVDTHVHINEPGRTEWEGFASATCAAAAGGITTLIDMPLNSVPATTKASALEKKRRSAQKQCRVDVGFLGGVVPGNVGELPQLWADGVFGFKCFLAPSGVDGQLLHDQAEHLRNGRTLVVHDVQVDALSIGRIVRVIGGCRVTPDLVGRTLQEPQSSNGDGHPRRRFAALAEDAGHHVKAAVEERRVESI